MGATSGYTITQNWNAEPTIEWPQVLETDDGVVAFIKDLRQFGLSTTSKMDNSTGRLRIITGNQVGTYQKSLMYEPEDLKFWAADDPKALEPIVIKPPKSVWTLQEVNTLSVSKPQMLGLVASGEIWGELYGNHPASPVEVQEDHSALAGELSKHIPDIRKQVKGPCGCKNYQSGQIWNLIQHLNDYHHPDKEVDGWPIEDIWTRERIADWLDEVDADLAFDPDLPAKREAKRKAAEAERQRQREALIKDLKPSPEQMEQIKASMATMTATAAGPLKSSMVKLNVALDEFSKNMHETVKQISQIMGPIPGCTCADCKAKLDLYPEKFPDQEES